jgi:hypothetical protein
LHVVFPLSCCDFPGSHLKHVGKPIFGAYLPLRQLLQVLDVVAASLLEDFPDSHAIQHESLVAGLETLYRPLLHDIHSAASTTAKNGLYFPNGQSAQLLCA